MKEVHEELGDDLRRAVDYVSHLDELLDLALRRASTAPDKPVVEPRARVSGVRPAAQR